MYVLRKVFIFPGHLFKGSSQPQLQSCLMEMGQSNAQIHLFDGFLSFGKSGFIIRIKVLGVFGFTHPPRLGIFCRGSQPHHFQRLSIGSGHVLGKRSAKIRLIE